MVEVAIIMGSDSDRHIAKGAIEILESNNVSYDIQVISAHRNPEELDKYLKDSDAKIFIAIAGLSAALSGVIASKTDKAVLGVPVSSKLGGLDALLSTVQMPKGVPVASVGIDNSTNAALMAVRILNLSRNK
ncbi:MAG: 5-(carboxyamino)imidazole ribonucleotide mutase [Candidatus Methanomarinus sp.]|nr:MAG: 5-(carboxyamino)imidazole ribonucleotide mutase [ANME-2 cluster archaeon]KAF5425385.1 5-(carboxyamino)imidazole ribonucleotide mutase [ANME-2 cluster archaeon]